MYSSAFAHELRQLVSGFGSVLPIECQADAYDEIMRRQAVFVQSEPVADDALHIVALMCAFRCFFADDQAEPRMVQSVVGRLGDLQQIAAAPVFERKNG